MEEMRRYSLHINVYNEIDNETAPTLPEQKFFEWDIRLDWNRSSFNQADLD